MKRILACLLALLAVPVVAWSAEILVTWDANTDLDFLNYDLQRSVSGGAYQDLSMAITDTFYVDTDVRTDVTYAYKVRARDTDSNVSAYSTAASEFFDTRVPKFLVGGGGNYMQIGAVDSVDVDGTQYWYAMVYATMDSILADGDSIPDVNLDYELRWKYNYDDSWSTPSDEHTAGAAVDTLSYQYLFATTAAAAADADSIWFGGRAIDAQGNTSSWYRIGDVVDLARAVPEEEADYQVATGVMRSGASNGTYYFRIALYDADGDSLCSSNVKTGETNGGSHWETCTFTNGVTLSADQEIYIAVSQGPTYGWDICGYDDAGDEDENWRYSQETWPLIPPTGTGGNWEVNGGVSGSIEPAVFLMNAAGDTLAGNTASGNGCAAAQQRRFHRFKNTYTVRTLP